MRGQPNSRQEDERKPSQFKEMIIENAQKGAFNRNPLLSTTHFLTCQKCKHRQSIVYLDRLKSGEFEFGKVEQIEVLTTQGSIGFLEMEKFTPIIITLVCDQCGCKNEARPVSFEYLQFISNRPRASGTMFV